MTKANDRIACVAIVGAITDRQQTIHSWISPDRGRCFMAFPQVVLVEGENASAMLYRYRCDGEFCGDTWHASFEEARDQAQYEYGTALGPWLPVPPDVTDAHAFAVKCARENRDTSH
jgi:hypothetical protein